jgi:hypothetical protein
MVCHFSICLEFLEDLVPKKGPKKNQGRCRCSFGGGVGVGPMGPRVRRGITGGKLTLSTLKDGDFPVCYVSLKMVIYHFPYSFWQTNIANWKITIFKFGKSTISMGDFQ